MLLEMNAEETRELREVMDAQLRSLLEEIAHADNRAYREMLRNRYQRLEQLHHRLGTSVESEQLYA
jgi:hypothetical protein